MLFSANNQMEPGKSEKSCQQYIQSKNEFSNIIKSIMPCYHSQHTVNMLCASYIWYLDASGKDEERK